MRKKIFSNNKIALDFFNEIIYTESIIKDEMRV